MTDAGVRRLTIALVLLGVALRTWQHAAGAAFWLDEIAIARKPSSRGLLGGC